MNILSEEQYQLLGFIAACNASSYYPTATQVMLWHENPEPRKARYRTVQRPQIVGALGAGTSLADSTIGRPTPAMTRMIDSILGFDKVRGDVAGIASSILGQFSGDTYQELVTKAESVIDHMVRLTWLEKVSGSGEEPGLRLTELGRALLRDREVDRPTDEDVSVVVLEAKDPLAYPVLVGWLTSAGEGLLIDPYLKLEGLDRLVVSTRLTRLLVSGKPANKNVVSAMQTYLASASLPRNIEVRMSTDLHDRILLAENGAVSTLGTSLNSVGRTTTVMTPMSSPAREALRRECERLWDEAELVGPQPVEEVDDEPEGEGDEQEDATAQAENEQEDEAAQGGDEQVDALGDGGHGEPERQAESG